MANRKILAIVTALVMLGSSASSQQTATIAELRFIETLVSNQRWVELYNLVQRNPRLTQGTDPLSLELRDFVRQVSLGRVAGLAPSSRSQPVPESQFEPTTRKLLLGAAPNIY